jgi:hypothetical protein
MHNFIVGIGGHLCNVVSHSNCFSAENGWSWGSAVIIICAGVSAAIMARL